MRSDRPRSCNNDDDNHHMPCRRHSHHQLQHLWVLLSCLLALGFLVTGADANHHCTEHQFVCNNNNCIDRRYVCDGEEDCEDGTDEYCDRLLGGGSSTSTTTPSPNNRKASFRSSSCEIPKTDPSGRVTSPNYPLPYEEDFSCDYVFIAEPEQRIQLNFTLFNLECSSCACCDVLDLHEPGSPESASRFCCSDSPSVYTSDDNVLILRFSSRSSDPELLPDGALVREDAEGGWEEVGLKALGRAAAAGRTIGFEMTYKHVDV